MSYAVAYPWQCHILILIHILIHIRILIKSILSLYYILYINILFLLTRDPFPFRGYTARIPQYYRSYSVVYSAVMPWHFRGSSLISLLPLFYKERGGLHRFLEVCFACGRVLAFPSPLSPQAFSPSTAMVASPASLAVETTQHSLLPKRMPRLLCSRPTTKPTASWLRSTTPSSRMTRNRTQRSNGSWTTELRKPLR